MPEIVPPALLPPMPVVMDRAALEARLAQLRAEHASRPQRFQPPPGTVMSDEELAIANEAHQKRTAELIKEQLSILAQLRLSTAGPPAKRQSRAKAPPVDLAALMSGLLQKKA